MSKPTPWTVFHVIPGPDDVFTHEDSEDCLCGVRTRLFVGPGGQQVLAHQHMSMRYADNPPLEWDWSDPEHPLPHYATVPPAGGASLRPQPA